MTTPLLEVRDLRIRLRDENGGKFIVTGLTFKLFAGETLAIMGESGAGKTLTARALLGLLPGGARATGSVRLQGKELLGLAEADLRQIRGRDVALIQQDPGALNPTMTVGRQVVEAIRVHSATNRRDAKRQALRLLEELELPRVEDVFSAYPHQLSGGMRQRVMIAAALAAEPKLIIADESTSGLDVVTRAAVVARLRVRQQRFRAGLVMITHDAELVRQCAERVVVMPANGAVEGDGVAVPACRASAAPSARPAESAADAFVAVDASRRPALAAATKVLRSRPPLLEARKLSHAFPSGSARGPRYALRDVSFSLEAGETLGVVGESGAGKSTLARALMLAPRPSSGSVLLRGTDLTRLSRRALRRSRHEIQIIFQDPVGSLDPSWSVAAAVAEPLLAQGGWGRWERRRRVDEALDQVGLPPHEYASRLPRELSGGQCQRVAIARALVLDPSVIICDEPVSSLDAAAKARVLEILKRLQAGRNLSYVLISHDLATVRAVSDCVAVMHAGELCELARVEELFLRPRHSHTRSLVGGMSADVNASRSLRASAGRFRCVSRYSGLGSPCGGCDR